MNEQKLAALKFYRALGVVTVGRSKSDGAGRPFPILHPANFQHERPFRIREGFTSASDAVTFVPPERSDTRVGSPYGVNTPDDPTVLSSLTLRRRIPAW
jgi:hypothetical protein